jgi:hypothetical protein
MIIMQEIITNNVHYLRVLVGSMEVREKENVERNQSR